MNEPEESARENISRSNYDKAMADVAAGTGDLLTMAVLAVAREIQQLRMSAIDSKGNFSVCTYSWED